MKSQEGLRRAVEGCARCTESRLFASHTGCAVVSRGESVLLVLKGDPDCLAGGHLEIVPISHVSSMLQADDETALEVVRFQSCIRAMYEKEGKTALFLEAAVAFRSRPHAHIDVIPVERGMEAEAAMSFRQAFLSCDEEWAQHRKAIELTAQRPLRRAVPAHFCYLLAEWGDPDSQQPKDAKQSKGLKNDKKSKDSTGSHSTYSPYGGIVHPVEVEEGMDAAFCLDVVAGMLGEDCMRMRRARAGGGRRGGRGGGGRGGGGVPVTALSVPLLQAVEQFKQRWSPFDWTQYV
ncbi:CwfJ C-terminus 1-domain-containing protein-like protein [Ochromonadaceae sp. CCMP2298]|nr:CwfJ C-terminus 1-domain-containing protein-like protein [Ochromonadaceae sp. CCMP2298]